jgi:hypothetical protein
MMAFGAGALLFASINDLFAHAIHSIPKYGKAPVFLMCGAALIGSLIYQALNSLLEKRGGFYRQVAHLRKVVHRYHARHQQNRKHRDKGKNNKMITAKVIHIAAPEDLEASSGNSGTGSEDEVQPDESFGFGDDEATDGFEPDWMNQSMSIQQALSLHQKSFAGSIKKTDIDEHVAHLHATHIPPSEAAMAIWLVLSTLVLLTFFGNFSDSVYIEM